MSEPENIPVLRRKIRAFNAQSQAEDGKLQKALRQAFARAAQDAMALEILASGCREARVSVDELLQGLEETHLLLLLKGPGDVHGLAVVSFQMVAAVVEHLTTGRVVPNEAIVRDATRTDAMMISDLLDYVFSVFDASLSQISEPPPAARFRCMMVLNDQRAVSMALEEVPFRQLWLNLDLGRGAKSGEVGLYFPYEPPRKENFRALEAEDWKTKWQEHVMQLEAPIEAVIHRVSMSLEEVSALAVGSMISVPAAKINEVSLEGVDGKNVAAGKLGQISGNRAIRISTRIETNADAGLSEVEISTEPLLPEVTGLDAPEVAEAVDVENSLNDTTAQVVQTV